MSGSSRQRMNRDIADFVSDDLWLLLETQGDQIVALLRENGYDFSKSRASQILRIIESTNSPPPE
jgi:hypothetical protein